MAGRLALLLALLVALLTGLLALTSCMPHCHGERCPTTTPIGWY